MRRLRKLVAVLLASAAAWLAYDRIADALGRDQAEAWAHYHRARALKKEGRLDEAERALRRAVETALEEEAEFHRALGYHYSATRRYRQAVEQYREAIRIDPKLEGALLEPIAWCHMQAGSPKEALATVERVRVEHPDRYTPRLRDFRRAVEYELSLGGSGEKTRVAFSFLPPGPGEYAIAGGWDAEGRHSEAYGFAPIPLSREGERLVARVELDRHAPLPYQVVLTSSAGPIGFERFAIAEGASQQVTLGTKLLDPAILGRSTSRARRTGADGRRRAFVLWPDCGSWWFFRGLAARGLAPNLSTLLARGIRAEMRSDPPLTSIAMQKILAFDEASWTDAVWLQLKGIQFFDELIEVDRSRVDTVAKRLAKSGVRFVDLTFNEPFLDNQGDQSEQYGFDADRHLDYKFAPKSEVSPDSVVHRWLALERLSVLVGDINLPQRWGLATQWDDTESKLAGALAIFAREDAPDALLLRLPAIDVLTHMFFENTDRPTESNVVLEALYLYLDDAIGRVRETLDEDDLLFVISDHGVRDKLSHDPIAMFVAEGPGLEAGATLPRFPLEKFPHHLVRLLLEGALAE